MRMRKKKNLVPRMERCAQWLISDPQALRGNWRSLLPGAKELPEHPLDGAGGIRESA